MAYNTQFGMGMTVISDMDNDGFQEIAIGAPNDPDGVYAGAVYVVYFNTDGTLKNVRKISHFYGNLRLDASQYVTLE